MAVEIFKFMKIFIIVVTIFLTAVTGSCTSKECPKGSAITGNSDCNCECRPDYYREDVHNYESRCYKFDCPIETKKILNVTYPSMIPTCMCDVETKHWGLDNTNCNVKQEGCPNGDLVRETGECGCRLELKYVAGECLPVTETDPNKQNSTELEHPDPSPYKQSFGKVGIIAGCSVVGIMLAALFGFLFHCCWRRRQAMKEASNTMELGENDSLRTDRDVEGGRADEEDINDLAVGERNQDGVDQHSLDSNPSSEQNESARSNEVTINKYYGPVIVRCSDFQIGGSNSKE